MYTSMRYAGVIYIKCISDTKFNEISKLYIYTIYDETGRFIIKSGMLGVYYNIYYV